MSDWLLYLIIAAALAFAVSSWWGVRRLKALHTAAPSGRTRTARAWASREWPWS